MEIAIDERINRAIEHTRSIAFFMFCARIFDKRIGMEDIVADLRTPAGRLTRSKLGERPNVLFGLHLSKFTTKNLHRRLFVLEL